MDVKRRQSRQILLEEQFKLKVMEVGRRHTMQKFSRKTSILPPISTSNDFTRIKARAKSIGVMKIPISENFISDVSLGLPPLISDRKISKENQNSHWNLPNRRVSQNNNKIIVDHLRTTLLRQHEKRSMKYEDEIKSVKEEGSEFSFGSSEETLRWKQSFRSRGPSLSTLNFSSLAHSLQENAFETSMESMRSFASFSQQSFESNKATNSSLKFNESFSNRRTSNVTFPLPSISRPSICVSFASGLEEADELAPEKKSKKSTSKEPSLLRKSISQSEISVNQLMDKVRRQSELIQLSEFNNHSETFLQNRSIQSPPVLPYSASRRRGRINQTLKLDDVYSDLPIDKVSLFADWLTQRGSSPSSLAESFNSDCPIDRLSSRGSCLTAESRPVTAVLQAQDESSTETGGPDTEDKTSDEALSITDTDPLERATTLRRVFLGDATASTSKIKLKVIVYLSSARNDSHLERSSINDEVKQQLQHFCGQRHLDFELIDLENLPPEMKPSSFESDRWWLLTDDNHQSNKTRINLLKKSFSESIGPCFISFLGETLDTGSILPSSLPVFIFDGILRVIENAINKAQKDIAVCQTAMAMNTSQEENKYARNRRTSLTTRRVSHIASDVTKSEAKLKEFEDELERLKNNKLLLKDWFFLDSSSQPQQYKLKRISSVYSTFSPTQRVLATAEVQKRNEENWKDDEKRLLEIILDNTDPNDWKDEITKSDLIQWRKQAFESAIEIETNLVASLPTAVVRERCHWFRKQIFEPNFHSNSVSKFYNHNEAVQNLIKVLLNSVGFSNTRSYSLPWSALQRAYTSRDNSKNNDWTLFVSHLRADFYNVCCAMIEKSINKNKLQKIDWTKEEVYQHVAFAQALSKHFNGREDLLTEVKYYLRSKRNRKPYIICGATGSGKSSLLSRASQRASAWMQRRRTRYRATSALDDGTNKTNCKVVFRSIGLSGNSSEFQSFLISLCCQLQQIADFSEDEECSDDSDSLFLDSFSKQVESTDYFTGLDLKSLTAKFYKLLSECGDRQSPLFLFLDNVDLLYLEQNAREFKWLPTKLPRHVKVVMSLTAVNIETTKPKSPQTCQLSRSESLQKIQTNQSQNSRKIDATECLIALKHRFDIATDTLPKASSCLKISDLHFSGSGKVLSTSNLSNSLSLSKIVTDLSKQSGKVLTQSQIDAIISSCQSYPHALAASICIVISHDWTSLTTFKECCESLPQKAETIAPFIHCFFRHLEERYGRPLVGATASYISSSFRGLTNNELKSLLAYDKHVSKWLSSMADAEFKIKAQGSTDRNSNKNSTKLPESTNSSKSKANEKRKTDSETIFQKRVSDFSFYQLMDKFNLFLMETLSDQKLTLRWKHVAFQKVTSKRYMPTQEVQVHYQKMLSNYFNNFFPNMDDSQILYRETSTDLGQPLFWKTTSLREAIDNKTYTNKAERSREPTNTLTRQPVYNLRRLNESFHHFLQCRSLDDIKEHLFFNFEWLLAFIRAVGYQTLAFKLVSVLSISPSDKDLRLLAKTLHLSRDILRDDPTQLGGQLAGRLYEIVKKDKPIARLDPRKFPFCRQLLGQCRRSSVPVLVPSGTCLSSPNSILFDLLLGHSDVITALTITTDGLRVITASKDKTIKTWDLFSGFVVSTLEGMPRHVTSLSSCLANNYVCVHDDSDKIEIISLMKSTCLLSLTMGNRGGQVVSTVVGEGSCFLVVFLKDHKEIKVWDLNSVRLLHTIDISVDGYHLRNDQYLIAGKNSVGSNCVFFSFFSADQAYVYNIKRAKHLHTLKLQHDAGRALITLVETSREYYVIACKRQYMRLHEMVTFELYDSINYGHVRTLKACPEDQVLDIFINRLGSHLIGLCRVNNNAVIGVWNVELGIHQHLDTQKFKSTRGYCMDLQYCITWCGDESIMHVHNLAARIDEKTLSRTHVKKKTSGIGEFYPVTSNSRYVVARGVDNGPITVWNITRGRCKGEAVSIERGLLDKNDVIVVKDVMVIILSDRGVSSSEEGAFPIFNTVYIYDLRTKKYTRKLTSVAITVCPHYEYKILDCDKLLTVSPDRSCFLVWSLEDGQILNKIVPDFDKYKNAERKANESREKKKKFNKSMTKRYLSMMSAPKQRSNSFFLNADERKKRIDQMLLSEDESTLLCSFYGRHVAVFDMKLFTHVHTLTNKHSMLLLHQAKLTDNGSHLVHTNYDEEAKLSYITLWNLKEGKLDRRLRNEPHVCALAVSKQAEKVVFATEDNFLKIWQPFHRGGHQAICGYNGLRMRKSTNDCQGTTVYLTSSATRALLFTYDLSLWDLEAGCVLARFTPDVPFQCCTVAMNGNLVVVGMREHENVVTLRLLSRDINVKHYGRDILGEANGEFGEMQEKDSESSEDEIIED